VHSLAALSISWGELLGRLALAAALGVTGIGFLGAGAIIRCGFSVRGLTTAATLWVVAAVGLASGAGYYSAAAITTGLVLILLWPLRLVTRRFDLEGQVVEIELELPRGARPEEVVAAVGGLEGVQGVRWEQ